MYNAYHDDTRHVAKRNAQRSARRSRTQAKAAETPAIDPVLFVAGVLSLFAAAAMLAEIL